MPLAITVGLCYLLFHDIDFDEMTRIIRTECRFGWIACALAISILSHIFRALRWQIQLRALDIDAPVFPLVLSVFGCYAVNLVFPRLGEIWRTGYIAHRQGAPFTTVFGSMIGDRLADMATVLLLTALAFGLAAGPITQYVAGNEATYERLTGLVRSPWVWCTVVAAAGATAWLMWGNVRSPFILKIRKAVADLWEGFAVLFRMRGRLKWLLLTVCVWGCYFVQMWLTFFAFDFTRDVFLSHGIVAVLVTFVLSSISMGVPSNGGIGPWQWAVIFALAIYGVPHTPAGAFANVVLGSQTLLLIILGLFTFGCIAFGRRKSRHNKNVTQIPSHNE